MPLLNNTTDVREKAVEAMVELMTHLASTSSKKKSLSLSNSRLECDLAIVAALVDSPVNCFYLSCPKNYNSS